LLFLALNGEVLPNWVQNIVRQCRFRNFGTTAMQMAYVASGGLVGTVACTPKLWDIAAGVAIAEAAGAVTTNWQGQPLFPMELDTYEGRPFQLLLANRTAHPTLLAHIKA
jgi:fructose-1,6-bisphosphatase/inositol monophosphatase family enzyme